MNKSAVVTLHGRSNAINSTEPSNIIDFGIAAKDFTEKYFERTYYLRRKALASVKFDWRDIDELLFRLDASTPHVKLFNPRLAPGEMTRDSYVDEYAEQGAWESRINKAKFYEHLRNGATLVWNRLDQVSLAASRLCHQVARFTQLQSIGNGYLCFGGEGTFGKHWDTHDVFVIQLLGRKRWQLFKPTWPLPLAHQRSAGHEAFCPSKPTLECELQPGDMLYLPRGWWHQALPCTEGSFHLSIGTYAPTVSEFVQWLCQHPLSASESMRLGLHGDMRSIDADGISAHITRALRDPEMLKAFLESRRDHERVQGEFDLQHQVNELNGDLADDTCVSLNSKFPVRMQGMNLVVNGLELRLEALRRQLVLFLDGKGPLALRDVCNHFPTVPRFSITGALKDLAQHEVITLRHD